MQLTTAPGSAIDLSAFIGKLSLTAPEKKQLATAQERIDAIYQLGDNYLGGGRARMKAARFAVSENPTAETVERLANAIIAEASADAINRELKLALAAPANAAIDSLAPVALRTIDTLAENVRDAHKQHLDALKASPLASTADEAAAQRSVDATLQWLDTRREWIKANHAALDWLRECGLAD